MIRQNTASTNSLYAATLKENVPWRPLKKFYRAHTTFPSSNDIDTNYYLGHLFTINGEQIIIAPPNNIYQLKEEDTQILSIIPAQDTAMSIDIVYSVNTSIDASEGELMRNYIITNGQEMGTFDKEDQLYTTLVNKYNKTFTYGKHTIEQTLIGIQTVNIDTQPGAVVCIRTSSSDQEQYIMINDTGELLFDPNEEGVYITDFIILGFYVPRNKTRNRNNISDNLKNMAVDFDVSSDSKIYYNHQWRNCQDTDNITIKPDEITPVHPFVMNGYLVEYPISAMLNYNVLLQEVGY